MTLNLDLPAEVEELLVAAASRTGREVSEYALALLRAGLLEARADEAALPQGARFLAKWEAACEREGVADSWSKRDDLGDSLEFTRRLRDESNRGRGLEW